jgi:hypothetical protein
MTGITVSSATATGVEILKHFHGKKLVILGAPAVIQRYALELSFFFFFFLKKKNI